MHFQGELLHYLRRIDANWVEGKNSKGRVGIFPRSYVIELGPTTANEATSTTASSSALNASRQLSLLNGYYDSEDDAGDGYSTSTIVRVKPERPKTPKFPESETTPIQQGRPGDSDGTLLPNGHHPSVTAHSAHASQPEQPPLLNQSAQQKPSLSVRERPLVATGGPPLGASRVPKNAETYVG
jgi:hypothetical protein